MPRPTVIVVCRSFTNAWSQPRLELCIFAQVPAHVYTRPFYVIKCFFFFSPTCTQTILVLIHTDTHIQHVQSPIGRRPQARSCIWQESNWACLMVDIQERSREKQTCSDEGERRAISLESSLSLSLCFSPLSSSLSLYSIYLSFSVSQTHLYFPSSSFRSHSPNALSEMRRKERSPCSSQVMWRVSLSADPFVLFTACSICSC